MALNEAEKTDARRFCGYPALGVDAPPVGALEYRLLNLSVSEEAVTRTYLATLRALEAAIPATAASLDTQQAAVWTRNPEELRERTQLFADWCKRLCGFLGVPAGPASLSSRRAVAMVV